MSVYDPFANVVSLVFRINVAQTQQAFDILARNVRLPRPKDRNDLSVFRVRDLNYDELLTAISEQLRRPSGTGLFPGEELQLQVYCHRLNQFCDVKTSEQLWHQVYSALPHEIRRIDFNAAINFNIRGLATSNNLKRSFPSTPSGASPSDFNGESPSNFNDAFSSAFNDAFTYQFDSVSPSAPSGVSGPGLDDASSQSEVIVTPDDDNEGPPDEK